MHLNDGFEKDCIVSDRGGIVENTHQVHAAIVDSNGQLLYSIGKPDRITLLRSAAKPAQALAIMETGALEKFGFDDHDLALICASHNSEERHLKRARAMLERISASEGDLQCGGHPSISPEIAQRWIKDGIVTTAIYNNCSGKHAGMLAGAKSIGAGLENYHHLEHPMQQQVKHVVEDLCEGNEPSRFVHHPSTRGDKARANVEWAVDGCNLPAPAIPVRDIARMFASFAAAAGTQDERGNDLPDRTRHMACIFKAMSSYPELVAGEGRFCTALMKAFAGSLMGKVGADGCYGVAIRESARTRQLGAKGAVGICVKVEDGDRAILYSAVVELLEQLDIGSPDTIRELSAFHHPPRLNTMNVAIGGYSHRFNIRQRPEHCANAPSEASPGKILA